MEKKQKIKTLKSPAYSNSAHCTVFDRYNGAATGEYASLNVGLSSGDDKEKVILNRKRVQNSLPIKTLLFAQQVHKCNIAVITSEKDFPGGVEHNIKPEEGCDAMITARRRVGLAVQHADCQAVMLFDPECSVIAAIHCGWRGNVQNIIAVTVKKMTETYETDSRKLLAFIGPSLGVCCAEFINYKEEFPPEFASYRHGQNRFDLQAISCNQLQRCGVPKENIVRDRRCTCCCADFFSYRRAKRQSGGITGRNCTVIFMP